MFNYVLSGCFRQKLRVLILKMINKFLICSYSSQSTRARCVCIAVVCVCKSLTNMQNLSILGAWLTVCYNRISEKMEMFQFCSWVTHPYYFFKQCFCASCMLGVDEKCVFSKKTKTAMNWGQIARFVVIINVHAAYSWW